MGKALSYTLRCQIIDQHESGQSLKSISQELGYSYSCIRRIWHRYQARGKSGLGHSYERCGGSGPRFSALIYRAGCWLKRLNPRAGAPLIQYRLAQRYPDLDIPSIRTLQIWFSHQKLQPKKRASPPRKSSLGQRGS